MEWDEVKDQAMATFLHETLCKKSHSTDCNWNYEKTWGDYVHSRYLDIAKQLRRLSVNDLTLKFAIRLISKL